MTTRSCVVVALCAAACGDVERVEGEAPTTSVSPPPGAYATIPDVVLTADQPATIYYTTDGSDPTTESASGVGRVVVGDVEAGTPLRFFAVGATGAAEEIREATYTIGDRIAEVTGLTVEPVGSSGAEVSWDAPAEGAAGVLLVRLYGPLVDAFDGTDYQVGERALGGEVVYRGDDTSFTDEGLVPGVAVYAIYAVDAAGHFSRGVAAAAELSLPAQIIRLSIDTGNDDEGTRVTVEEDAPQIGLSVLVHDESEPTAPELALYMVNHSSRVLYNPKLVLRSAKVGDQDIPAADFMTKGEDGGGTDGELVDGAAPFFSIEPMPHGWAPGVRRGILLEILDRVADTTIDLELEVLPGRMLLGTSNYTSDPGQGIQLFDPGAARAVGFLTVSNTGPGHLYGYRHGAFSLDGRHVYLTAQNSPVITVYDLVTLGETQAVRVTGEHTRGHVRQVALGRDGRTLYALFTDGAHHYHFTPPTDAVELPIHVELVAIDSVTWEETGRVRLATLSGPSDVGLRGRTFDISPDGRIAAIPVVANWPGDPDDLESAEDKGSLHLVDLDTLEEIDTDDGENGVQPIALGAVPLDDSEELVVVNPGAACFAGDGRVLVGTSRDQASGPNGAIEARQDVVVDVDVDERSAVAVLVGHRVSRCVRAPGGALLGNSGLTLYRYDLDERTATDVGYAPSGSPRRLLLDGPDHALVFDTSNTLARVPLAGGAAEWSVPTVQINDWVSYTPY